MSTYRQGHGVLACKWTFMRRHSVRCLLLINVYFTGKGTVYVHCKAGRARSATLVAAYLIEVVAPLIY